MEEKSVNMIRDRETLSDTFARLANPLRSTLLMTSDNDDTKLKMACEKASIETKEKFFPLPDDPDAKIDTTHKLLKFAIDRRNEIYVNG